MDEMERNNWWYLGRRAIVSILFRKYFKNQTSILDLGCGTGEGVAIVSGDSVLTGVDVSETALSFAKEKGYRVLRLGSGDALPFENNSFDGILMLDVLEHITDDVKALAECARVLKIPGNMILTVPAYQWLWSGHDEVFGHKRRYGKNELIKKIKKAGFKISFASYYVTFLFPVIALFRILEKKFRNKKGSHFFPIPRFVNITLFFFMRVESVLLKRGFKLPFGSSIAIVAQKNTDFNYF